MKLKVIAFGKLKTPGLRESADYYKKIIASWVDLEEIELKPLPVTEKSAAARKKIQSEEGELLLARLGRTPFYILDETGKSLPTQAWAEKVRKFEMESSGGVAFCVGSSLGFSPEVRKAAQGAFSFGLQTLPHELARVVLLEQLYRAWSVTRGHPYHNEGS